MAFSKPREAALKTLVSVEKDGAYLNLALRDILSAFNMDSRDNALSTQIAFGVMKNKLYIDNIIKNISSVKIKKLSVWILNILRMGVYQIVFLDKIPKSAAVNESVNLAKKYGGYVYLGYFLDSSCSLGMKDIISSRIFFSRRYLAIFIAICSAKAIILVFCWVINGSKSSLRKCSQPHQ